jgi:tetratricopeptide (TPR) repeat protein
MKPPLCFVLMPFGKKKYQNELTIDFDRVYNDLIKPAVEQCGLEPIRADEEQTDGIIHKPMFERLILCDYAIADLTTANANVFYELGIRHAVKPFTTILIFADSMRLPFDVALLRAFPYRLNDEGSLKEVADDLFKLTDKIKKAKDNKFKDSPLYQLVEDYPNISHEKTDVFRQLVDYSKKMKDKLRAARAYTPQEDRQKKITEIEIELGNIADEEAGVVIDLFLSYRSLGTKDGFKSMVGLTEKMTPVLKETIMVQEQLAFALNRLDKKSEAETILLALIKKRGGSGETYGILGRIYKDQWENAYKANKRVESSAYLKKAIETYLKGFNIDWRDAYPGVNAITLMAISQPEDMRWKEVFPIVKYAVDQKIKSGTPDYWDYATLVELYVIDKAWDRAEEALGQALTVVREKWEPETTAKNIRFIKEARLSRHEEVHAETEIEETLMDKSKFF